MCMSYIYQRCNRMDCKSKDRRGEMTNSRSLSREFILMTVLLVFGLALFSGCATMTGETAGENIDDSTIHTKATAAVIKDPDAQYFKIDVSVTKGDVVLTGFINSR